MIPDLRQKFNAAFTDDRYRAMVAELSEAVYWPVDFRVAETPLFFDETTTRELAKAGGEIVAQLAQPAFREHAKTAIPPGLEVPDETPFPHFIAVDFALCLDAHGKVLPQLIELQGFPTVTCWQALLASAYRRYFPAIPAEFTPYFTSPPNEETYLESLRATILGDCQPENVVLLEIHPEGQKTRVDFAATHAFLNVRPLCVTQAIKRGRRLFYLSDGREVPIHRIYNRVIFDELLRKNPPMHFSFADELEVQWCSHPNWYFRISKHTLPFLKGRYVPECRFVSELGGAIPGDLENHVLKPLYSFAGLGVDIAPTREKILRLEKPGEWLLQRTVAYAPVLPTPEGPAKAEVRLIFAGDGRTGMPRLLNQLVRLTKGAMHGVDFNQGRTWVGASAGFHPAI